MSLDLTIYGKETRKVTGTGVFVRSNGTIYELQTLEEVKDALPDSDISHIQVREYETNQICDLNMTHNLTDMARHIPCGKTDAYHLLWHPELIWPEHMFTKHYETEYFSGEAEYMRLHVEWVKCVDEAWKYAAGHEEELSAFNPDNGWGCYEQLLGAMKKIRTALSTVPEADYPDCYIDISV